MVLARRRYQMTISPTDAAKISVEMALISGVMPRRRRPQISRGKVLSWQMRKKVTAISSRDRQIAQFRRKLRVGRQLGQIERRGQPGARDRRRDVARWRDDVIVRCAAPAQLGDKLVARAHIGRSDFTVMAFLERFYERGIGVAFPNQQTQRFFFFLASAAYQCQC